MNLRLLLTFTPAVISSMAAIADVPELNMPIIQTKYTADPSPMLHNDTIFLYTSHDESDAEGFKMYDWLLYTTTDMVNWQDRGAVASLDNFKWHDGKNGAWAQQVVERNGKYYMYCPIHGHGIGVLTADSPYGPFTDPIGKPLVWQKEHWYDIDPTVFIDDDGQAYLYWGNPEIYYVKLNKDMISFDGDVHKVQQTIDGFGAPGPKERVKDGVYKDFYTEGPWFYKRNGKYYLLYAAGGVPEHIAYSMSDTPVGPWKYMGEIMPLSDTGSFTNHAGVVDYKGKSYFFYHTGKLPHGGGFGRSVAVEEFSYNPDGTFPTIMPTDSGVPAIATFNPYKRNEAETMAWSEGIKVEPNSKTGVYVSDVHDGDYIRLSNVDFGSGGPRTFCASVASALRGGTLEVRLDKRMESLSLRSMSPAPADGKNGGFLRLRL